MNPNLLLTLVYLGLASFLLTLAMTPFVRNLFLRNHCVDLPDGDRKSHPNPTPRGGGLAVFLSYGAILGSCWLLPLDIGANFLQSHIDGRLLVAAILLVLATGLWDDLCGIRPWQKMLGLFLAALLVWASGIHVRTFGLQSVRYVTLPITVFWLLGCANAFNLIDGMDGLAAGLGSLATLTILIAGVGYGRYDIVILTLPLLCCLLAFLYFNFNPASIFLGDSGSLTLGFTLGCFGAIWSHKAATLLGLTAPLIAFAIPLSDVALAIARRYLRNQSIFLADAGHIHHRLLKTGMTVRRATLLLYACAAFVSILSLALSASQQGSLGGFIVILFAVSILVGVHRLGYREFSLLRQFVVSNFLRRWIAEQTRVDQLEVRLAKAKTVSELWNHVTHSADEFNLVGARLDSGLDTYETHSPDFFTQPHWELAVPFAADRVLRLYYSQTAPQGFLPSSLALVITKHLQRLTLHQPQISLITLDRRRHATAS